MKYKGVIFDMDGTLIDNMSYHESSWMKFLQNHGVDMTAEEFDAVHKGTISEVLRRIFGQDLDQKTIAAMAAEKEGLYREIYAPHVQEIAGLYEFLEHLRSRDTKIAMATMSDQTNVSFVLNAIDIRSYFDVIVTSEHITLGKPNPQIFLLAAQKLGLGAHELAVFEDSKVGISAGIAAEMDTIAVLTSHTEESLKEFQIVAAIDTYESVNLHQLFKLVR